MLLGLSGRSLHLWNLDERSLVLELKDDLSIGQSEIQLRNQLNLVFQESPGLLTEVNFPQLRAIHPISVSPPNDVSRENEVLEHGVINGSESPVAWNHLLEVGLLVNDGSFRENEGVPVFLLLDLIDNFGDQGAVVVHESEREVDDEGVDGLFVGSGELEFSDVADEGGPSELFVGADVRD